MILQFPATRNIVKLLLCDDFIKLQINGGNFPDFRVDLVHASALSYL